jgi:glutaredoxin
MLKRTLSEHNIPYTVCEDKNEMAELNITSVPVLSVDGTLYSFKDALKLIKKGELN